MRTGDGWCEWCEAQRRYQLSGEADKREWNRVLVHVKCQTAVVQEWVAGRLRTGDGDMKHRDAVRTSKWIWSSVEASRHACKGAGGWEYLVWWEGGDSTWESKSSLQEGADARLRRAMERAEQSRWRPNSMHALIQHHASQSGRLGGLARAARRAIQGIGDDDDEWKMVMLMRYHAARM